MPVDPITPKKKLSAITILLPLIIALIFLICVLLFIVWFCKKFTGISYVAGEEYIDDNEFYKQKSHNLMEQSHNDNKKYKYQIKQAKRHNNTEE